MRSKKIAILTSTTALGALLIGCIWAGSKLPIWKSVPKLWDDPWFKITLLDLYIGFLIVGAYIMYRERSVMKSVFWLFLLAGLGNMATLSYIILELINAKDTHSILEAKHEKWRLF